MPNDIKMHKSNDTIKSVNAGVKDTVKGVKSESKHEKSNAYKNYEKGTAKAEIKGRGQAKDFDKTVGNNHTKTTVFKDIKTPGVNTAGKLYSDVKQGINAQSQKDHSVEGKVLSTETELIGVSGTAAFVSAKTVNNIPARISRRKNVVPEQKAYSKLKKEIKNNNRQSKQNIKEAKRQYKDIKSRTKRSGGSNQTIKSAKNSYKSTKQVEKYNMKISKRIEKQAAKKLKKLIGGVKKLKLFAVIAAAVLAFVLMSALMALLASPTSIMFAEDDNDGSTYSVKTAISSLNTEFADVLKDIIVSKPHDTLSISNYGCQYTVANWQDIFAVWDIKQLESGLVAVIEAEQYNEIRNVLWDMVSISSNIEKYLETAKDENGEDVEVEKVRLVITVEYMNVDEMAELYSFDTKQKKELKNLMKTPEFTELFSSLSLDAGGIDTPIIGAGQFVYPTVSTAISAGYPYYSDGSYHGGVDFPVPMKSNVFAVNDGIVIVSRELDYGFGYYIMIDHGNGLTTLYGHNSELLVEEGQTVHQGDIIALSGSTGNSTGPHCHFEVRVAGNRVNPFDYLKK